MKKTGIRVLLLLAVLMGGISSEAATKGLAGRISVSGNLEKDRNSSKEEGEKSSSRSKTETQFYDLKVTAANTGKTEGTFDVEWYFFKRPLDNKGKKGDTVLAGQGKKTIQLKGMKRQVIPVQSEVLSWSETKSSKSSSKKNSSSSSKKTISGAVYGGYLVLLKADGEIISRYSPDNKMKSDDWLREMSIPFQ